MLPLSSPLKSQILFLIFLGLSLCGCAGNELQRTALPRGPAVVVKDSAIGASQADSCRRFASHQVLDHDEAARDAGMLDKEYHAIREGVRNAGVIATFRHSNPACLPHLAGGVQSKPHAVLQKTWDVENLLPQDRHLAGLVSPYLKKPAKGVLVPDPQLTIYKGEPVTCDYDLMDLIEPDGRRVAGDSTRELEIRNLINSTIPVTPQGQRDRIMHGSQAGYPDYLRNHTDEEPVPSLFKPEAPITVFIPDGTVHQLDTVPDVIDFYLCKGVGFPPEWDVKLDRERGKVEPQ